MKTKNPYGFSLMELLLALGLISIVGMAVIVFSPPTNSTQLHAAAKQIQADIEYAKQNAIKTRQTSGAQFTAFGTYTVYENTVATPLKSPLTKQDLVNVSLAQFYPGISISSNYTVLFNSFGAPTTGGGGGVTISNGSSTKTISVSSNTGRVKIQ